MSDKQKMDSENDYGFWDSDWDYESVAKVALQWRATPKGFTFTTTCSEQAEGSGP